MSARFCRNVLRGLRIVVLGLPGICLPAVACAQALRDPTRPPAPFLDPADTVQTAAPATGLQSIRRSGKRRVALLHGEWVRPGDKAGEAVVERIDEQALVLRHPDGSREIIPLYPDVEMKPARAAKRAAAR